MSYYIACDKCHKVKKVGSLKTGIDGIVIRSFLVQHEGHPTAIVPDSDDRLEGFTLEKK